MILAGSKTLANGDEKWFGLKINCTFQTSLKNLADFFFTLLYSNIMREIAFEKDNFITS